MFAYVDGNDDRFPSRFFNAAVLVTITFDCINDIAPAAAACRRAADTNDAWRCASEE